MENDRSQDKQICKAMIQAGISFPDRQKGIDFCVNHCPYSCCIVFEREESRPQTRSRGRAKVARALRSRRVSIYDIALILDIGVSTIKAYLKKNDSSLEREDRDSEDK